MSEMDEQVMHITISKTLSCRKETVKVQNLELKVVGEVKEAIINRNSICHNTISSMYRLLQIVRA